MQDPDLNFPPTWRCPGDHVGEPDAEVVDTLVVIGGHRLRDQTGEEKAFPKVVPRSGVIVLLVCREQARIYP